MKSRFVDTNIFLEVFTRTGKKSDACKTLLEDTPRLWASDLVIAETEWVLRSFYELERHEVSDRISSILLLENLDVSRKKLLIEAVEWYRQSTTDWVDIVNVLQMQAAGVKEIYSYDKHFDKIPGIKRLER